MGKLGLFAACCALISYLDTGCLFHKLLDFIFDWFGLTVDVGEVGAAKGKVWR